MSTQHFYRNGQPMAKSFSPMKIDENAGWNVSPERFNVPRLASYNGCLGRQQIVKPAGKAKYTPEEDRVISQKFETERKAAKEKRRKEREEKPNRNRFTGEVLGAGYTPEEDRRYTIESRKGPSRLAMSIESDSRSKNPKTIAGLKARISRKSRVIRTSKNRPTKEKKAELNNLLWLLKTMQTAMKKGEDDD